MSAGRFSKARLGRMHSILAGAVERGDMPGLVALVSRRGETHVQAIGAMAFGGEPMRRDAIFRIASLSKPVTAAAAMILVEECVLRLDDPVDRLLPELADRRVLTRPDSELNDTIAANRPITLRDLLAFRMGFGLVLAPPDTYPIQAAIAEAGFAPSADSPTLTPDEWMARLGSLPLLHQPGEGWMYHTGSDVLGVLIARATGTTLEAFLQERLFVPLGMTDTGFHVPAEKLDRLPTAYWPDPETGTLQVFDAPADSRWGHPPAFPSAGGGLVSTVDDYLAFCRMLLNQGRHGGERILSRPTITLMTTDQLTPEEKAANGLLLGAANGWGFGMAVCTRRGDLASSPGRFGWNGGTGTSGYSDPAEDLAGILMTQRLMNSPTPPPVHTDFWTSAYAAIDD